MKHITANEPAKKNQIMQFLHERVFDPILESTNASNALKSGIRLTVARLQNRTSTEVVSFVWVVMQGTDRSVTFSRQMRLEGFTRFEDHIEDFRNTFNDRWMKS